MDGGWPLHLGDRLSGFWALLERLFKHRNGVVLRFFPSHQFADSFNENELRRRIIAKSKIKRILGRNSLVLTFINRLKLSIAHLENAQVFGAN